MLTIGLGHYLVVAAVLFTFGVFGIFLNRKNVIVILMCVELMLLAVNINLVAFSVFQGNVVGQVFAMLVLTVAAADGVTRRKRVYEDGPLRARFPNTDGDALEAVIVNTAGGIAGGDSHAFDISLGENAALTMTTAAAEKVYRALDDAAEIYVKLSAATGARLLWVP